MRISNTNKYIFFVFLILIIINNLQAQKLLPFKLPDTGQYTSYTNTKGEDCDLVINPMSFTDNGNGTITDNNTGLVWQKTDGGEMTFEDAINYCSNLNLGGFTDWRLPTAIELFSINSYDNLNPALNSKYFTKTQAEYWWTSEKKVDDSNSTWVVNAGGGVGAHPKSETKSAGGSKLFHVRAVRNPYSTTFSVAQFTDLGNGTIKDNFTGLIWQKIQLSNQMSWEEALSYASSLNLADKTDWRLPNIKELQSLNDTKLKKPSIDRNYFSNITTGNFWSSTSMFNTSSKAWDINLDYGIVSYNEKTQKEYVLCVRGGKDNSDLNISEGKLQGGEYEMGDHFGYVDPKHPSDELPVHKVKVSSFYLSITEATNHQFLAFLNDALMNGEIEVRNNIVYPKGKTDIYFYTNQYAYYYSIGYDGKVFSMSDFRSEHPVVGVIWYGAIAFCNWLSRQNGLDDCYNLDTYACDFTKNGYRLPTEAEWEYAAHGGYYDPYYNYPWGANPDNTKANWPQSNDPYEGKDSTSYPLTTPVGFYNGKLHLKSEFNWRSSMTSYQTSNGANPYGLYDMAGNVWEFVNDWYSQDYYKSSPYENPTGPASGFIMPDGKQYRGMRGGNWYNGDKVNNIDDGHSRVSNRNPSYYRGPQDPNHPWYHIGFRFARNFDSTKTDVNEINFFDNLNDYFISPNPAKDMFTITNIDCSIRNIVIYNSFGEKTEELDCNSFKNFKIEINTNKYETGLYFVSIYRINGIKTAKLLIIK